MSRTVVIGPPIIAVAMGFDGDGDRAAVGRIRVCGSQIVPSGGQGRHIGIIARAGCR